MRSCQVFKYAYLFSQRALSADDRAAVFDIIAQLNREQQVAFLIAEQNINVALRYASQAYVPDTGRVVLSGTPLSCWRGATYMTFIWVNSKGEPA